MEILSHPAARLAGGLFGDGWIGRLVAAAEPWLLERLRVVAPTPVEQVHLGWGGEAAREVVVSWCTPVAVSEPFVAVAERIVPARSDRIPGGGWAHHAWVSPLEPGTAFTYAVGHGGRVRSRPSRFRTAPVGPAPFAFTAFADHGTDRPPPGTPPTFAARRTVDLVETLEPAFHLVAGDLSYANGDVSVWDRWFRMIEPSARSRPWMACVGNHEVERSADEGGFARPGHERPGRGYGAYVRRLPLPKAPGPDGECTFGTFRYAGVRFVLLDNNDVSSEFPANRGHTGGAQAGWLRRTLEHAATDPAVEAIVVVMHQPAFSSATSHGSDQGVRGAWHDLFTEHGVSLVLQGHDHLYERTHPVGGTAEEPTVTEGGVTYVTCGIGGFAQAGTASGPRPEWSAVRDDRSPGVVHVAVEPATTDRPALLTVTQHSVHGDQGPLDTATIEGRGTRARDPQGSGRAAAQLR